MSDMDICFKTHEHTNDNGRFMIRFVAAELDGVEHRNVVRANVLLSDNLAGVSVTFAVEGLPEFVAVDANGEPIDGWDPARVQIPEGIELDWQTIVEVAEQPTNWRAMLGGEAPPPTNLRIGMLPFPNPNTPVRALQRIVWIELNNHHFNNFANLRIDAASDEAMIGPAIIRNGVGELVEAYYTVTIELLGSVSLEAINIDA